MSKPYLGPEELVEEYRATIRELSDESRMYQVVLTDGGVDDILSSAARGEELLGKAEHLRDALLQGGATVIESHATILQDD